MNNWFAPGKVYLVGAGPGDEGLITVRGLKLLQSADAILYDGLANESLLRHAKKDAICLCVGKHGHGGMWTQREIDNKTVELAREGKSVVRLKGGDTTIFARTSEEIERLQAEGITFEVIPGITAALAASAYTGIPLTHRDWSSAVALVTGQLQPVDGDTQPEDDLDWQALARFPGTLVLYMGVTTAKTWSEKLMQNGKLSTTAVALARRISWPDQQVIRCELASVATTIEQLRGFRPPVIAIIGDVVNMAESIDWFSVRPLHGQRLIVASPEPTSEKLSSMLESLGASVVRQPAIQILPPESWEFVDEVQDRLSEFDWIVFASPHGVDFFMERLRERGRDARCFGHCKIASIGTATSESLAKWMLFADRTPQVSGIETLIPLLLPESGGKRFLFVRTAAGKTLGMDALISSGAAVTSIEAYRQVPVAAWPDRLVSEAEKGTINGIVVTSQNIASHAIRLLGRSASQLRWYCLSDAIKSSINESHTYESFAPKEPSLEHLVELIKQTSV